MLIEYHAMFQTSSVSSYVCLACNSFCLSGSKRRLSKSLRSITGRVKLERHQGMTSTPGEMQA